MKNLIFIFVITAFIMVIPLTGCGKASEQEAEKARRVKSAKAEDTAEWQKFKTDTDEQIKASGDRIDAFKAKMGKFADTITSKPNKPLTKISEISQ